MGKPMGMSSTFQIIRPTAIEDAIWDAVQLAIDKGMDVRDFKDECRYAWQEYLKQKSYDDRKEWDKE